LLLFNNFFFGIQSAVELIRRLGFEYQTLLFDDLEILIIEILVKLDGA
jgi:hypothetical protein